MNLLLIFFAFPIAVIIVSVVLQKLLKNPILVAAFIFAIFLIVTFAAFDANFLIATLAYTILSFITALLVSRFCNLRGTNNRTIGTGINNNESECLQNILTEFFRSCNNTNNTNKLNSTLQELVETTNDNNIDNNDNILAVNNSNSNCNCRRRQVRNCRRF